MNGVEYLLGSEDLSITPSNLFSDEVCSFTSELSSVLMASKSGREYADIATLAFWSRKGNINKLRNDSADISRRLGRGLCFHFSSPNIPTNFAYSWLISLLAGNANIVKLPEKTFPQVGNILEAIHTVINNYPDIRRRTAFVQYASHEDINGLFSSDADARMIWGGNQIIKHMKQLDTKPRCIDIVFGDRYSVCMINGKSILDADDAGIRRLAEDFYNDTYLVDQNANSSPQLILWVNDSVSARERFWGALLRYASDKYDLKTSFAIDKYTQMCDDAIETGSLLSVKRNGSLLYRAELGSLKQSVEKLRGIGGYFYEYSLGDISELRDIVSQEFQTITQFGMEEDALLDFIVSNNLPGIDRIVRIGKAMNLGLIWDGYDLISMLSRIIYKE